MKDKQKKKILSHLNKDSKEFKAQIKEDQVLKKEILKSSKKGK